MIQGWVFGVKLSDEDIADFEVLRDVAMATIFGFLYMGAYWRHLKNTTEPSICGGDAALCQITLSTCYYYFRHFDFTVKSGIWRPGAGLAWEAGPHGTNSGHPGKFGTGGNPNKYM